MKKLLTWLQDFNYSMINSFVEVIQKYKESDVCDDKSLFWKRIENNNYAIMIEPLEHHLIEEFCEYFGLAKEEYTQIIELIKSNQNRPTSNINEEKELTDIANIAFLLWCIK